MLFFYQLWDSIKENHLETTIAEGLKAESEGNEFLTFLDAFSSDSYMDGQHLLSF